MGSFSHVYPPTSCVRFTSSPELHATPPVILLIGTLEDELARITNHDSPHYAVFSGLLFLLPRPKHEVALPYVDFSYTYTPCTFFDSLLLTFADIMDFLGLDIR